MQGSYIMLKINLLISMWLLQPLYALFVAFMTRVGRVGRRASGRLLGPREKPASRRRAAGLGARRGGGTGAAGRF